ncbi:hypothetical protein AB0M34_34630 [Nocardia sp. NPDC050193]
MYQSTRPHQLNRRHRPESIPRPARAGPDRTGAVSAALLKLDTALRAETTNLIEASNKVLLMRDTARDTAQPPLPAFEVADDGTVSAQARIDHLRRAAGDAADSPEMQRTELGQRLVAASHQWHIVNALKTAADTASGTRWTTSSPVRDTPSTGTVRSAMCPGWSGCPTAPATSATDHRHTPSTANRRLGVAR